MVKTLDERSNESALYELRQLVKSIEKGEVQIETCGKWPIGQWKRGMSIYWTIKENEDGKQSAEADRKRKTKGVRGSGASGGK